MADFEIVDEAEFSTRFRNHKELVRALVAGHVVFADVHPGSINSTVQRRGYVLASRKATRGAIIGWYLRAEPKS